MTVLSQETRMTPRPYLPLPSTPEREAALLASVPTGLLIGGQWRDASDGGTFDVHDPATGEVLATLASATSEDAVAALDAADAVQASWARTAPRERAEILRRAFDLVTERAEDFALLMTLEMGKPLAEARGEVTYGAEFLRWFSEETVRDYGRYLTTPEGKNKILVQHKPVGPCLLITPWNFPLAMATRKVAPAVAAGCTMVLKPAKLTPLTAQYFAQTMLDAGLPAGVLNVVSSVQRLRDLRAAAGGLPAAEGLLHRLHPGGQAPHGRRRAERAAHLHGARRQRTVHRVRGRRPGQGRRRGHGRQDAEHGRGLHRRQPLPRPGIRRRGVHPEVRRRHGRPDHRPRHRPRHPGGPADRRRRPRRRARPGDRRRRRRSHRRHRRRTGGRARLLLPAHRPGERAQRRRDPPARKSSAPSPPSPPSPPRRTPSGWPTPANTAWPPTSTAATSTGCCAWPNRSNSAWSASTPASSPTPPRPSAASSNPASGREGGSEGIAEYTTTQYIGIADPWAAT